MPGEEDEADWERDKSPGDYGPEKKHTQRRPVATGGRKGRKAHLVCKFHLQGRCKMGNQCEYYHEGDKTAEKAGEKALEEEKEKRTKAEKTTEEAKRETERMEEIGEQWRSLYQEAIKKRRE